MEPNATAYAKAENVGMDLPDLPPRIVFERLLATPAEIEEAYVFKRRSRPTRRAALEVG